MWAFRDKYEGFIYPSIVCPFQVTRGEAIYEKKKYPVFYENTIIVKVIITEAPRKEKNG